MLVKNAREYVPKHPLSPLIFLWVCIFVMLYNRTVSNKPQHVEQCRKNTIFTIFLRRFDQHVIRFAHTVTKK